jgi:hypothetical protein
MTECGAEKMHTCAMKDEGEQMFVNERESMGGNVIFF